MSVIILNIVGNEDPAQPRPPELQYMGNSGREDVGVERDDDETDLEQLPSSWFV